MNKLIAALAVLFSSLLAVLAQTSNVKVDGLAADVTVRRDSRGIPYIEAGSDKDVYFAQGFITASDRLWQMDLMRRVARGETAEIFGKRTLEEDQRWRRFNFSRIADENLKYLSPDLVAALESYARGVNAFIATLDDEHLPAEFRLFQYRPSPWRASDT